MGKVTGIEWTDHTWNPWQGCRPVSAGCDYCYMFRDKKRFGQDPTKVVRSADATFNAPLRWKQPGLVFACSWSDWFHPDVDAGWRADAWSIVRATPWLTYLLLTKRVGDVEGRLPADWGDKGWPNVWLGATVEGQWCDWRIEGLMRYPAAGYFVSHEPALSVVRWPRSFLALGRRAWIIAGGETGPAARPVDPAWFLFDIGQAMTAGAMAFFKGFGDSVVTPAATPDQLAMLMLWKDRPAVAGGEAGGG